MTPMPTRRHLGIGARRFAPVFAGLAILGFAQTAAYAADGPAAAPTAPLPSVLVAAVENRPLSRQGRFIGTIQAIQQVEIRARVEGFLDQVAFDQGSMVKENQLLYRIDPAPFQAVLDGANAQYAVATAQLASAEATLLDAQAQLQRFSTLVGILPIPGLYVMFQWLGETMGRWIGAKPAGSAEPADEWTALTEARS